MSLLVARRLRGQRDDVPAALLALLFALPAAAIPAQPLQSPPAGVVQQAQRAAASSAVKPTKSTHGANARPARNTIKLAALGEEDLSAVPSLTEEEGLLALEHELSLKVGKHLQTVDYPEEALRWRWTGTALIEVLVAGDGMVKHVALSSTSGFRVLDEQALIVVRRVPRVFVPAGLRMRDRTVTVPVGFYLQNL